MSSHCGEFGSIAPRGRMKPWAIYLQPTSVWSNHWSLGRSPHTAACVISLLSGVVKVHHSKRFCALLWLYRTNRRKNTISYPVNWRLHLFLKDLLIQAWTQWPANKTVCCHKPFHILSHYNDRLHCVLLNSFGRVASWTCTCAVALD